MTDFQAEAGRQGRQFAKQCDDALKNVGFELQGGVRLPQVGVELDQVAIAPSSQELWFEYKGSLRGSRPGLLRTDTTKKAIANGVLLKTLAEAQPFVVLTSHLPEKGFALAMLNTALEAGYIEAAICIYSPGWEDELRALF
ncbi:MAG TPA: hypothetical protein VMS99_08475 [Acidimicrobiia bacterium]|nr:hypothetical protein [Acidimicrobiia bacterium]